MITPYRKPFRFTIPSLLVFFVAMAATGFHPAPNRTHPTPRIVFERLTHDYGTIPRNSDGTTYFRFTNRGDAPLIITGVKAACGCTVPSYTREPILPGQSGQIKVEYNTRQRGVFTKTITVNTNDPANPTITLTVKGNVVRG